MISHKKTGQASSGQFREPYTELHGGKGGQIGQIHFRPSIYCPWNCPHPELSKIDGVTVWAGNSLGQLRGLECLLEELDHLAIYVPDEDDTDSVGNVEALAEQCRNMPKVIEQVRERLRATDQFFADENLDRLPELMSNKVDRWSIRRITARLRKERAA